MADANRMQGVLKVQKQNLYGSEPSTDCTKVHNSTLQRGFKMVEANDMQVVIEVQNQNLYGSEPSTHCINKLRPSLWRRSVSESDTDPMASDTNPLFCLNKVIPVGQTVSQPNVFSLGFMNNEDNQMSAQRSNLETRAAEDLRRFEIMKTDISEWKTSEEHHFASINSIIDRAHTLTRISKDLARDAIIIGVDISVCGRIAD